MELALTEAGSALRKSGECLVVRRRDNSTIEVPAEDVSEIFVIGKGISVSSDALQLAIERGIPLAFLSRTGEPYALVESPGWTSRAALRRAQLQALEDRRGTQIARAIVVAKLCNQENGLRYLAKSRKESAPPLHATLHTLADAIGGAAEKVMAIEDGGLDTVRMPMMGYEAEGARHYWEGVRAVMPENLGFSRRVRRGATDPVNVCLNYGYGILYAKVSALLESVGLDPHTGYLHAVREGAAALAYDFTEIWRQVSVDRPVLGLLARRWQPGLDPEGGLEWESRRDLAQKVLERFEARVPWEGASRKVSDVMRMQAHGVARAIDPGTPFVGFVAGW